MLTHRFFLINYDEIPKEKGCSHELIDGKKTVNIHDDIVVNNESFLKGFKTFKVSFKNSGEGLDYHGITIIPETSLNDFAKNIEKIRDQRVKPLIKKELKELIALCEQAMDKKMYLIHFGI